MEKKNAIKNKLQKRPFLVVSSVIFTGHIQSHIWSGLSY